MLQKYKYTSQFLTSMYKVIDIHVSQILNTDLDSLKAANLVLKMSEIKYI